VSGFLRDTTLEPTRLVDSTCPWKEVITELLDTGHIFLLYMQQDTYLILYSDDLEVITGVWNGLKSASSQQSLDLATQQEVHMLLPLASPTK
jgi:hypothetical protein